MHVRTSFVHEDPQRLVLAPRPHLPLAARRLRRLAREAMQCLAAASPITSPLPGRPISGRAGGRAGGRVPGLPAAPPAPGRLGAPASGHARMGRTCRPPACCAHGPACAPSLAMQSTFTLRRCVRALCHWRPAPDRPRVWSLGFGCLAGTIPYIRTAGRQPGPLGHTPYLAGGQPVRGAAHPGVLATKVGYFGVKSAKVPHGADGHLIC